MTSRAFFMSSFEFKAETCQNEQRILGEINIFDKTLNMAQSGLTRLMILLLFTTVCQALWSQSDFSSSWEDFFSYNNVKDFVIVNERIYAVADNAAFIYDLNSGEMRKISSVQGLSGKETTCLLYSESTERFVIGYQSGLIEVIDSDGKITIANDIERLDISGQKQINHIEEFGEIIYLSTPFGIVGYDLENLNFGDTYYIDEGSNPVFVNQTAIDGGTIYAATVKGIYTADVTDPNLIDFNRWLQPEGELTGNFRAIEVYRESVFTSKGAALYRFTDIDQLENVGNFDRNIIDLKAGDQYLSLSNSKEATVLDPNLNVVHRSVPNGNYDFQAQTSLATGNHSYIGTTTFGILKQSFSETNYQEIHPEGPTSNQVFSIAAKNKQLWVVYGGYDGAYTPLGKRLGYSHYNGSALESGTWMNRDYDPDFPARDLVNVTFDPENDNRVFISSWNSGMLVVENDEPQILWNDTNSGLEDLYPEGSPNTSIRINGSAFDSRGNLWVANAWVPNRVKKYDTNGVWKSADLSSIITNPAFGLSELVIDRSGSVWIGSRRNGALVYNESGDRKRALITEATKGSLPDLNVRTLAVDRNNRIWIGTQKGLVVFSNASGLFDADIYDAEPVIVEDDGVPRRLLGDQPVNSIAIDGAENKWFGTDTGGVLGTNPSGSETLYVFNKDNSPLPSNRVLKVKVDDSDGRVYFATDKGIVAFDSGVAPYGESLEEVYAYPNPARKNHEFITIDGRNGAHLPRGTNVKILDTAGRLVHETNVEVGQEAGGGKVIWNRTNLRGRKVASGVYIVLLTLPDTSETASTKIAIIN